MKKRVDLILASLTSAVSGVIIGILLAPDKGSKTRKKISEEGDEYLQSLKGSIENMRQYLDKRAEETKEELSDIRDDVKHRGEDILEKAKKATSYEEWTKEELYELAKESNIEGYSQMNKGELLEAVKKQ
jgi:gas vesicle protein